MARFGGLRTGPVSALLREKLGLCSVSIGPSTNPMYSWLSSGIFMLSSYNIENCGIALFLCGTEQICTCLLHHATDEGSCTKLSKRLAFLAYILMEVQLQKC